MQVSDTANGLQCTCQHVCPCVIFIMANKIQMCPNEMLLSNIKRFHYSAFNKTSHKTDGIPQNTSGKQTPLMILYHRG